MGLIALAAPASADTVPSTFDPNCNVNFVNGGCDGTGPSGVAGGGSFTFAKQEEEKYCNPKETRNFKGFSKFGGFGGSSKFGGFKGQ